MRRPHAPAAAAVAVQLTLGLAAHVLVDGCLPSLQTVALMLPVAAVAVAVAQRLLRNSGAAARLAAGQTVFHALMTVVIPCAGHGSASAHAHPAPGVLAALLAQAAMPLAHLAVVGVCLLVLGRVERLTAAATERMHTMLRRMVSRLTGPLRCPVVVARRRPMSELLAAPFDSWVGRLHGTRAPPAPVR